jgi:uncharacterized protein
MAKSFELSLNKLALLSAITLLVASCATPQNKTKESVKQVTVKTQPQADKKSVSRLLNQAKESDHQTAISLLIEAAQLSNIQGNYKKALWLAKQTVLVAESPQNKYQLSVIQAQALANLGEFDNAYKLIEEASLLEQKHRINHTFNYWMTRFVIQEYRGLNEEAAASLIHAADLTEDSKDTSQHIWQKLSLLSRWQLDYLEQLSLPEFAGWYNLIKLAGRYAGDFSSFEQSINIWQSNYPKHQANLILDELNPKVINQQQINKITVILPLSGQHRKAGQVAQQGILAAYEKLPNTVLEFVDSQHLDFDGLSTQLIESETHAVIGPLLKNNVEKYIQQTDITVPTLLLNTINSELPDHISAMSMRPEDEAIQAATTLAARNYKHPLILSHQDSVSQRITDAFVKQWFKKTGYRPQIVGFSKDSNMQKDLKTALEVQQSEERIKRLDQRIDETFKVDERNRRDIDMVYLVGKPVESRIAKPYIDVNIAPFADFIPVYASSRSHNGNTDKSELRDLSGLVFTEMPWLLPSEMQDKDTANTAKQLWPSRSDSLSRIFAMGYDSYQLIFKLQRMKQFPVLRHYGQTGVIMRQSNGLLTRSLLWGKYYTDRVEHIEMENVIQAAKR